MIAIAECEYQRHGDGATDRRESPQAQIVNPGEDTRGGRDDFCRDVLGEGAGVAAASPEICCLQGGGVCRSLSRTVDMRAGAVSIPPENQPEG